MARKKVVIDDSKYKVFAFMKNPHILVLVGQDGFKLDEIEIESGDVEVAKLRLENKDLNAQLVAQLGTGSFSTIWIEDPAGDAAVVEACRIMEEKQQADRETEHAEIPPDSAFQPGATEPNAGGQIEVHSKGIVFQTMIDGAYKNVPANLLQIDDICRYVAEVDMIGAFADGEPFKEYRVVAAPMPVGTEDEPDFLIQLKEYRGEEIPEKESTASEPHFEPSGKTKMIDVEVPETFTEQKLKSMIRQLQTMKLEALADAAARRDEIKEQEKAIFAACNGKSFKPMECTVEEDWEAGERRYIRPDTGEVALSETIPFEERQLNMNKELDEATPKTEGETPAPETEKATDETESAEGETEQPAGETQLSDSVAIGPETAGVSAESQEQNMAEAF